MRNIDMMTQRERFDCGFRILNDLDKKERARGDSQSPVDLISVLYATGMLAKFALQGVKVENSEIIPHNGGFRQSFSRIIDNLRKIPEMVDPKLVETNTGKDYVKVYLYNKENADLTLYSKPR